MKFFPMFSGLHLERCQEGWQRLKMRKETLLSRAGAKARIWSILRMIQYNSDDVLDGKELYSEKSTFKEKPSRDQGEEKGINDENTSSCKVKSFNELNGPKDLNIGVDRGSEYFSMVTDSFNNSICKLEQALLCAIQESREEILLRVSEKIEGKINELLEKKFFEFSNEARIDHNTSNDPNISENNENNEENEGEMVIRTALIDLERMERVDMLEDRPEPGDMLDTQLIQHKLKDLKKENENCQARLGVLNNKLMKCIEERKQWINKFKTDLECQKCHLTGLSLKESNNKKIGIEKQKLYSDNHLDDVEKNIEQVLREIELFKSINEGEIEIDTFKEYKYTYDTKRGGEDLYSSHENNVIMDIEDDSTMSSNLTHSNRKADKLLLRQDGNKTNMNYHTDMKIKVYTSSERGVFSTVEDPTVKAKIKFNIGRELQKSRYFCMFCVENDSFKYFCQKSNVVRHISTVHKKNN